MAQFDAISYHGNCHCGAFRFKVLMPQIQVAITCTCSLCTKKAYLWTELAANVSIKVLKDDGLLIEYRSQSLHDRVRV
jgi:hypothetical protein